MRAMTWLRKGCSLPDVGKVGLFVHTLGWGRAVRTQTLVKKSCLCTMLCMKLLCVNRHVKDKVVREQTWLNNFNAQIWVKQGL